MSSASLRMQLQGVANAIDLQAKVLVEQAEKLDCSVYEMSDPYGNHPMVLLLVARSNVLLALTNLEKK